MIKPWFAEMLRAIEGDKPAGVPLPGLTVAARPFVEAAVAAYLGRPVLIVTSRPDRAQEIARRCAPICRRMSVALFHWQTPDALPYEVLPRDPATSAPRLEHPPSARDGAR